MPSKITLKPFPGTEPAESKEEEVSALSAEVYASVEEIRVARESLMRLCKTYELPSYKIMRRLGAGNIPLKKYFTATRSIPQTVVSVTIPELFLCKSLTELKKKAVAPYDQELYDHLDRLGLLKVQRTSGWNR